MQNVTTSKNYQKKRVSLDRYAGQWVAFVQGRIVANRGTLKDLMQEIDRRGLRKKASVFLVPRKDEGPYILLRQR